MLQRHLLPCVLATYSLCWTLCRRFLDFKPKLFKSAYAFLMLIKIFYIYVIKISYNTVHHAWNEDLQRYVHAREAQALRLMPHRGRHIIRIILIGSDFINILSKVFNVMYGIHGTLAWFSCYCWHASFLVCASRQALLSGLSHMQNLFL